jgi:hypothetical protein
MAFHGRQFPGKSRVNMRTAAELNRVGSARKFLLAALGVLAFLGLVLWGVSHRGTSPSPAPGAARATAGRALDPAAASAEGPKSTRRIVSGIPGPAGHEVSRGPINGLEIFLVEGSSGAAIASAEVILYRDLQWTRAGQSDQEGRVWATLVEGWKAPLQIVARKTGFVDAHLTLGEPPDPARVVLVMARGRSLRGQVVLNPAARVPEGTFVFYWPAGGGPLGRSMNLVAQGAPLLGRAPVDADGRFEVEALREGHDYELVVSGPTIACFDTLGFDGSTEFLSVEAGRLFGCYIDYANENGGPLVLAPGVTMVGQLATQLVEPAARTQDVLYSNLRYVLPLLGVDTQRGQPDTDSRRLCLFVSEHAGATLGPISVQGKLPGYARLWTEVHARAGSALDWPTHTIPLTTTATGWGCLRIRVECAGNLPMNSSSSGWKVLAFHQGLKEGFNKHENSLDHTSGSIQLGPIPQGPYLVQVSAPLGWYREFECVLPESGLELSIDARELGSARFRVQAPDGGEYAGSLRLSLASERSAATVLFAAGPFVQGLLRSGKYLATVEVPEPQSGMDPVVVSFEVFPGAECVVNLPIF